MGENEVGLSKAKAHKRIPLVTRRRGKDEVNVSLSVKTPMAPKKNKGEGISFWTDCGIIWTHQFSFFS